MVIFDYYKKTAFAINLENLEYRKTKGKFLAILMNLYMLYYNNSIFYNKYFFNWNFLYEMKYDYRKVGTETVTLPRGKYIFECWGASGGDGGGYWGGEAETDNGDST